MRKIKIGLIAFALILLSGGIASAQGKPEPDLSKSKSAGILVPSSSEILIALKKAGATKWEKIVTYNKTKNYKGRKKQALNMGVRMADAFAAIADRDKTNFGYMNEVVFALTKSLGIDKFVKPYADKVKSSASKDDWLSITTELDEMNVYLIREMEAKGNGDIVLLSSIGGFFEGINVVSNYFSSNYNATNVKILYRLDLVEHYIKELDKNSSLKKDATVKKVYDGLKELQKIYKTDNKLSLKSVKSINIKTKEIIDNITKS